MSTAFNTRFLLNAPAQQHRQKKNKSKNKHANKQHKTKKTASNKTNKHQEPSIISNHAAGFCWHGRGLNRKAKVRLKEGPYASHVTPMVTWEGDSTAWLHYYFCFNIIYIGTCSKAPQHWVSSAMTGVTNDGPGKYIPEFSWKAVIIILNFRNFI